MMIKTPTLEINGVDIEIVPGDGKFETGSWNNEKINSSSNYVASIPNMDGTVDLQLETMPIIEKLDDTRKHKDHIYVTLTFDKSCKRINHYDNNTLSVFSAFKLIETIKDNKDNLIMTGYMQKEDYDYIKEND